MQGQVQFKTSSESIDNVVEQVDEDDDQLEDAKPVELTVVTGRHAKGAFTCMLIV